MMKRAVFGLIAVPGGGAGGGAKADARDFMCEVANSIVIITGYTGSAKDVAIPGTIKGLPVTAIGDWAFRENQLTSVVIPDGVTTIGKGAFWKNQLTSVTIGKAVATIGEGAFRDNLLTGVTLPDSVVAIGDGAFRDNRLATVTIPASVKAIGNWAFQNNDLTTVAIKSNVNLVMGKFSSFPGNLHDVYLKGGKAAGTYTRPNKDSGWTKE
jgi:hypothetical protein